MAMSHTNCTHPRTPAGRRACRAGVTPEMSKPTESQSWNARLGRVERQFAEDAGLIKITGKTARKLARQSAKADMVRIQPRRSGARVSAGSAGCVQAALHVDEHGGRCACGWVAA